MDRWLHAALFVAAGSLLGLAHPMVLLGPGIVASVWGASILGDLVFVGGMAGTYLLARMAPGWTAVPAAMVLTWLAYSLSWLLTGNAMEGWGRVEDAPAFVATWGWAGLLVCGFWPWVQRALEEKAERAQHMPGASVAPGRQAPDRD